MRRTLAARFGRWFRLLAAAVALLALVTWAVYHIAPERIFQLDLAAERWLTGHRTDAVNRAIASAASDPAAARAELEKLAAEFRDALPGDRDYVRWQRVTSKLIDLCDEAGDVAAATRHASAASSASERDYPARLRLCRLLLAQPERQAEGRRKVSELQRVLPEQIDVTRLFVESSGDAPLLVGGALATHLRTHPSPLWVLRYDGSDSLIPALDTEVLQPRHAEDGRVRLEFRIPTETRGVHIDVPPQRHWGYANARLVRGTGQDAVVQDATGSVGLRADEGTLWSHGGKGAIDFAFEAQTEAAMDCVFEADVQWRMAPWLSRQLRSAATAEVIAELRAAGRDIEAALLRRARAAAQMHLPGAIFTAGADQKFTPAGLVSAPIHLRRPSLPDLVRITFAIIVPLPDHCARVRFAPPVTAGTMFAIESLAFDDREAGAPDKQWSAMHDLLRTPDGQLQVTGDKPHLEARVPRGTRQLTIRGVLL